MQLNVLDDLAEAMKALDGKKDDHFRRSSPTKEPSLSFGRLEMQIAGRAGRQMDQCSQNLQIEGDIGET